MRVAPAGAPVPARRLLPWALLAAVLMGLTLTRTVDHDESQYVAATVLAAHGLMPYRDFAYLQGPLQPLLFAPLAWAAGAWTWPALRLVNALLGALTIAFVHRAVRRLGAAPRAAAAAAGLMLRCDILLFSIGVARNDALPAALFAAALVVMTRLRGGAATRGSALLTGLLLGAAAAAKVSYALPAIAYGVWALAAPRRHRPLWLILGAVPPALLVAWCWWSAPEGFLFGVFHFPADAPAEYYALHPWKLSLAAKLVDSLKFLALGPALVALAFVIGRGRMRALAPLLFACAVAALAPQPTWRQYWLPFLPPLFIALALAWHRRPPGRNWRIAFGITAAAGLAPSVAALVTANGMSLGEAMRTSAAIRATMDRAGVTGPVATLSPQFLPATGRLPDADFATGPFYFRSRHLLDPAAESRLHLLSHARPRVSADWVLIGGEGPRTSGNPDLDAALARAAGGPRTPVPGTAFQLVRVEQPPSRTR
ncbi:DUF2029 domain-containing protein [Sphingomonas sp. GM_Shp_2]|uniref:DUF2029 domain-containing protein n=1 Tax=Sphingomonas sp. GM_Shp_2 TaxID=2937380 RepID=UPI002269B3F2